MLSEGNRISRDRIQKRNWMREEKIEKENWIQSFSIDQWWIHTMETITKDKQEKR